MYSDIPAGDNEIIARIGDADAVLLSYTSQINRYILERCPNVRYIGMCFVHYTLPKVRMWISVMLMNAVLR